MDKEKILKKCPCCSHTWTSREEFLADPNLKLIGYQVNFKNLEGGLFLFTHTLEKCNSTMAIKMGVFRDLYSGGSYKENKALSEGCPRHCLKEKQLDRCDALCECAFARELLPIIREMQKQAKALAEKTSERETRSN